MSTDSTLKIDQLREKYEQERLKRLRPEGIDQYTRISEGKLDWLLDDPYGDPSFTREPLVREPEVLIIGAGLGTVILAQKFHEVGVKDLMIIDKAGEFGGTWYWNRYPGAQCDIESYIYLPLLEETGYMPTQKYADATEIREHIQRCARHLDLYPRTALYTEVTGISWDAADRRWDVQTDRQDSIRPRFVVIPGSQLLKAKLPGVPGLEEFQGHMFHTSRWDYEYTGGDLTGGMTGLADKVVGIVGTGATAIQAVPPVADSAKGLYVFQRTPSAVDVRGNRETDPQWAASLKPGWQRERMRNFTAITDGRAMDVDLVDDGWTEICQALTSKRMRQQNEAISAADRAKVLELADLEIMDRIRARVEEHVADRHTSEGLKAWYGRWCKRPAFHDEYLAAFNKPTATLVDTNGYGIDRVTAKGVVVGEVEYELDCLIFATGFELGTSFENRVGFDVAGAGGRLLSEKWSDGPHSLHGIQVHGFPNLFLVGHSQVGITPNFTHLCDELSTQIAYIISETVNRKASSVEVSAEAEKAWDELIERQSKRGASYRAKCTPSYYNNEGKIDDATAVFERVYGNGSVEFFELLANWRAQGDLDGLVLTQTSDVTN